MKKVFAIMTMLAVVATLIVGCSTATAAGTGTSVQNSSAPAQLGNLSLAVTDAPPSSNVTSILVTVSGVQVHRAGIGETSAANQTAAANVAGIATPIFMTTDNITDNTTGSAAGGGWTNIPLDGNTVTFDLLNIQGIEHYIGAANLTAGIYTQVRLQVTSVKVGLNGGTPETATLPSNVLRVAHPFKISTGGTTSLLFDFDASRMITVTGNGKVIVKPVVKLTVTHKTSQ